MLAMLCEIRGGCRSLGFNSSLTHGVHGRRIRAICLYITKVSILGARSKLLSVKMYHQLRANIDHFLVLEA